MVTGHPHFVQPIFAPSAAPHRVGLAGRRQGPAKGHVGGRGRERAGGRVREAACERGCGRAREPA